MVFKDLPAGTVFLFGQTGIWQGSYESGRYQRVLVQKPLKWKKTDRDGLSLYADELLHASFDYSRYATGTNRYMRNHGHRFFFLSSLYRYLNCGDESWSSVAEGDGRPFADTERGFLSCFSDQEVSMLQPFTMKVDVPVGYTKQYGKQVEKQVLVGLPSVKQFNPSGADFLGLTDRRTTWVTDADTTTCCFRCGALKRNGNSSCNIAPLIRIRDDAPVDTDENDHYIIRLAETDFDGNIDALLGFTA